MNPSESSKSNVRSKVIAIILILLFLLIGGCVFHRIFGRKAKVAEEVVSRPAATPSGTAAKGTAGVRPPPPPPPYEKWFIDSVSQYEKNSPSDEKQIAYLRGERARAISNALPGVRTITAWTGTLRKVETVAGGKASVVIALPDPTIVLQTWGNPISDAAAGTLIDEKSDLYRQLKAMKDGTPVSFDGQFLESAEDWCKEASKTPQEGLMSPKFIVRFGAVRSLGD
ncbi:MAG TPA: hypothetical protein VGM54_26220 [Chthoniobacter sp.]|jgi:hypothetical protein